MPRWNGSHTAWLMMLTALLPSLAAIWAVPWFVTQDGPAHVYNAHIIRESLSTRSPFQETYEVRWEPLPNWAGHISLVGLLGIVSPRNADRVMMTITLVGVAASAFWWRLRVAGSKGAAPFALLSALLAMNIAWLYGFWSFLLGTVLFSVTLAVWWSGREHFTGLRACAISALLIVGYFCHLVSLGLTILSLGALTICEPRSNPHRRRLWGWTAASVVPVLPLIVLYQRLMRGNGRITPLWMELKDPLSLTSWKAQFGWVEPISLFGKTAAPFLDGTRPLFAFLSPALWLFVAIVALTVGVFRTDRTLLRQRLGLYVVAGGLLAGGLFGPDTLGETHGNYLAMRLVLLGLIATVPAWPYACRTATVALIVAVVLQSAFVWDYALRSDRAVGPIARGRPVMIGKERLGTLLMNPRMPSRANPLLHADCLLGLDTAVVVWANYEPAFYYFPVQVRPGVSHPPILAFEEICRMDRREDAVARAERWRRLLLSHAGEIDTVMVWGDEVSRDSYGLGGFSTIYRDGPARILRKRPDGYR